MAKLQLIETTQESLESVPVEDGKLIFVKDTHDLYKDTEEGRVRIGDQDTLKVLHFTGKTTGDYDGSGELTIDIPDTPEDIGAAAAEHTHKAADITEGILPLERGGTNNTTGTARDVVVPSYAGFFDVLEKIDSISNTDTKILFIRCELRQDNKDATPSELSGYHAPCVDAYYTISHMNGQGWKRVVAYDIRSNNIYYIQKNATAWGNWEKNNDIGGTNILKGTENPILSTSNWVNATFGKSGVGSIVVTNVEDVLNPLINKAVELEVTDNVATNGSVWFNQNAPIYSRIGQTYTLSCYAKQVDDTANPINFHLACQLISDSGITKTFGKQINLTSTWQRYINTFIVQEVSDKTITGSQIVFAITNPKIGQKAQVCGMKLEVGSAATDWSPSPWDPVRLASAADKLNGDNGSSLTVNDDGQTYTYVNIQDKADDTLIQCHIGAKKATGQGFLHTKTPTQDNGVDLLYSEKFPPTQFVKKAGDTITGTLVLSKTTDLSATADNQPALIVGGTASQQHIEIDNNEIQAKSNGTTTNLLGLNPDGGTTKFGGNIEISDPTDEGRSIKYATSTRSFGTPIAFYAGDANGSGLVIGDGGRTIIGGGEAAPNLRKALNESSGAEYNEQLHLANDNIVQIHTNCNTIANRHTFTFQNDGRLSGIAAPTGETDAVNKEYMTKCINSAAYLINAGNDEYVNLFQATSSYPSASPNSYTYFIALDHMEDWPGLYLLIGIIELALKSPAPNEIVVTADMMETEQYYYSADASTYSRTDPLITNSLVIPAGALGNGYFSLNLCGLVYNQGTIKRYGTCCMFLGNDTSNISVASMSIQAFLITDKFVNIAGQHS